jgi:hypothetical protein
VVAPREIHVTAKKERKETLRTIEKPLDFMFRKCKKTGTCVPVKNLDRQICQKKEAIQKPSCSKQKDIGKKLASVLCIENCNLWKIQIPVTLGSEQLTALVRYSLFRLVTAMDS